MLSRTCQNVSLSNQTSTSNKLPDFISWLYTAWLSDTRLDRNLHWTKLRSAMTLNYLHASATLYCWEKEPSQLCFHFSLVFLFCFMFRMRFVDIIAYREAFIPVVIPVDDSLLFRLCSCWRPEWYHGTWNTRRAATFLVCTNVAVLWSPAPPSPSLHPLHLL